MNCYSYYRMIEDRFSRLSLTIVIVLMINAELLAEDEFTLERARMVSEIKDNVRYTSQYIDKNHLDPGVMTVMGTVPRHEFVDKSLINYAYDNRPLPIGVGQTISQPYIVALMTDLAGVNPGSKVLEIGTGSGYQAAVLAELVDHVYTIEIIDELGKRAGKTLSRLGFDNVTVRIGDGYRGWPSHAPFDAIVVTAAPDTVPPALIEQLKPGGRLVIPVGPQGGSQSLKVIEKEADGQVSERDVLPVMFVPFTRE